MTKSTRAALCLVMAAAIGLLAWLGSQYLRDRKTLRSLETQLSESRAAWEATAAAKEELQAELTQVNNDLREANLTIQESASRAAARLSAVRASSCSASARAFSGVRFASSMLSPGSALRAAVASAPPMLPVPMNANVVMVIASVR